MSHFILASTKQDLVKKDIDICKSTSKSKGKELRDAHRRLGVLIAPYIASELRYKYVDVVIMMRAGLCFGEGIVDAMEEAGINVSMHFQDSGSHFLKLSGNEHKDVLIVDAVINSGKSLNNLLINTVFSPSQHISIATTVIQEQALSSFSNYPLFAVRTSSNSYKGAKTWEVKDGLGPDTGDRLFNTMSPI